MKVYHGGWFGYVNGRMRYVRGDTVIVEDNDSEFWCVFEVEEQITRFGHAKEDIAAMWYKDPQVAEYEIGLMAFDSDRAALDMVRIAEERGYVELFVVHEGDQEGFPEIGYIDVGGDPPAGSDDDNGVEAAPNANDAAGGENVGPNSEGATAGGENIDPNSDGAAASGENGGPNADNGDEAAPHVDDAASGENVGPNGEGAAAGGENIGPNTEGAVASGENGDPNAEDENLGGRESEEDDSDDGEYVPSDVNSNSADDVHFTDSEDDLDLGDSFFGNNAKEDEGEDSDDVEEGHVVGGFGGEENGDVGEDGDGAVYPVHKAKANMAEYRWPVGTVYASRDEFKEAVSSFAVHTKRGIKFDKVDKKRVIVCCQPGCHFRLYCVKLNQEDTWQLRSAKVKHNCKQVQRVGIMHSSWLGKVFKKKIEHNPKEHATPTLWPVPPNLLGKRLHFV
ncbi:hypothetical protein PIB30_083295 [Stylosanthes scabra]|uniref:Transposase MuDR plant domain-containing protein n=1 Tax=Stylosanthes scabra TaxID=79078 RepID=A0ABU6URM1_9FABA|nr:hypothetical protein [Stylosanthes scabra]